MNVRFNFRSWRCWHTVTGGAWFAILMIPVIAAAQQRGLPPSAKAGRQAETTSEPTAFVAEAELLAAPTRGAWCSALSPDETWIATGYGRWTSAGHVRGRVG